MNAVAAAAMERDAHFPARDIRVRAFANGDAERWDRFVEHCPNATFFHRAGWRDIIENVFRHRCHYLIAEDASGSCRCRFAFTAAQRLSMLMPRPR